LTEEKAMQQRGPAREAHPPLGKEVMAVDDVDVDVRVFCRSIDITSEEKEGMGEDE
jgi:hypothetical protein